MRLVRRDHPILFIACGDMTPERLFQDPESVLNERNTLCLNFCPFEEYGVGWDNWLQEQLNGRMRGQSVIMCPHFDDALDDSQASDDSDDADSDDSQDDPPSMRERVVGYFQNVLEFLTPINNFFSHYYYRFF